MKLWVFFLLPFTATSALALGEYDGIYKPAADWANDWDCKRLGQDGGAMAVINNQFIGVERACRLSNPVNVRDIDATLFDADCSAEGKGMTERMMLMEMSDGIAVLTNGSVVLLKQCTS
ncbi:MAG: hypothetical protein ABJ370_21575 [Paracoccaceae bacterium]